MGFQHLGNSLSETLICMEIQIKWPLLPEALPAVSKHSLL